MLNRRSNLPTVQSSKALTVFTDSAAAIVAPGQVPKAVTRGIKEITLAYPAQGLTSEDVAILLGIYLEAVAGFACAVVIWTLRWLLFHNPRNTPSYTTRPTPQDVREACRLTHRYWQRWVVDFYFGGAWAKPSTNLMLTKENADLLQRHYEAQKHGKPGEPDCIVPADLQIAFLQEEIECQLSAIEHQAAQEERGEITRESSTAELLVMPDEAFERLPHNAFPDGSRETIVTMRKERIEKARQREEHEAYLKSLPEIVRRVRWIVFRSDISEGWSEDKIMAETKLRIAKIQREKADCQAARAIYVGTSFDDGTEFVELPADRRRAAFAAPEMTDEEFERRKAEMIEQLRKEGFEI